MYVEIICKEAGICGGIKRLYRVAEYLISGGHSVVINVANGDKNTWFSHSVPENMDVRPDIRIMPETFQNPHTTAKNILYVQAQFDPPESAFDAIVTTTTFLEDILNEGIHSSDYVIPYGFNSSLFTEDFSKRVPGRIGFMPRKGKQEIDLIKMFSPSYNFYAIDGLTEKETVKALQSCEIFIATSRTEGFGMPPFEAALCGCLVVGYHGKGGRQWLTGDTFVSCEFPQEFNFHLEKALRGDYEEKRKSLKNLVLRDLTVEEERKAWLNVINDIARI